MGISTMQYSEDGYLFCKYFIYTLHTDMFIISIYMCVQDLPYLVSCISNWACKASKSTYALHGRTDFSLSIQRYWDNMRLVVKQLLNFTITSWTYLRSCLFVRNIYEIVELSLLHVIIPHKIEFLVLHCFRNHHMSGHVWYQKIKVLFRSVI